MRSKLCHAKLSLVNHIPKWICDRVLSSEDGYAFSIVGDNYYINDKMHLNAVDLLNAQCMYV